jgi:hypothetical protein
MFDVLTAGLLLILLGLAAFLALRLRGLSREAVVLKGELASLRRRMEQSAGAAREAQEARSVALKQVTAPPPDAEPDTGLSEAPAPFDPPPVLPALGAGRRSPRERPAQAQLPLVPDPAGDTPPLPLPVLIRALQFPEDAADTDGFRALRRALRDHRARQVIQAAEDVLTLLSQDGLYMDDLVPDRAHPDLWRRFSDGERGGPMASLGGIRASEALALVTARMRRDPVFRDATHHFLRRFDRMLAEIAPEASDQDLSDLTDTRTARAFMLLGRAMEIFD